MVEEKSKIKKPTIKEQEIMLSDKGFPRYFKKIEKILREYIDIREEYYPLISCWIIGTYLHKQFSSYPYLFFNAMKGSGKTRMLKILANLSKNGKVAGSMTEAVLFRTAYQRTLCIDELENINAKGSENLKLLLNSAYKKGLNVERMTKKKTPEGDSQVIEEFKVYCPVAIANIWGMENVLSDRCISVILEKSSKKEITRLIENFENNPEFQIIRGGLTKLTEKFTDDLDYFGDIFNRWNNYIKLDVKDVKDVILELFSKIDKSNIEGRDLELFFPLFIVADMCSKKVLDNIINISKNVIKERHEQDREENRDIQIYDFVSQYTNPEFVNVEQLVREFKEFLGIDENWINVRFLGRGLRRLNLVINERRTTKRQVRLNIEKAQDKMKLFKPIEQITTSELDEVFNE